MSERKKPAKPHSGQEEKIEVELPEFDEKEALWRGKARELWAYDDTGHNLTLEEQLFCRSYIIDRNPVASLRRLNYSQEAQVLKRQAERYLSNPEVQGCIDVLAKRLMDKLEITGERVQRRLAQVAFFDPRRVLTFDRFGVSMLHSSLWSEDDIASVAGVEMGQFGPKIKFYDALKATEMLAKQLGVQKDETADQQKAAAEAGAEAVIGKLLSIIDRTVPDQKQLPAE